MEIQIAIILISILLSAFFSGMEIAYISANKFQVELEKKKEGFISTILSKITSNSSKFITTLLVGNNIALVVYSFFMGELITGFLPIDELNEVYSFINSNSNFYINNFSDCRIFTKSYF